MMKKDEMKFVPTFDREFYPIILFINKFRSELEKTKEIEWVTLSLERNGGFRETRKLKIFKDEKTYGDFNKIYVERFVKSLLWIQGGFKISISGPKYIYEHIKNCYKYDGTRDFDIRFLERAYKKKIEVEYKEKDKIPETQNMKKSIGGHKKGCRLGLDIGGSVRKITALMDGEVLFTDYDIWLPKKNPDIKYHYFEILDSLKKGMTHLPRVDAIGISSAGIVIDNSVMVSSLFRKIPQEDFDKVHSLFFDLSKELGDIPFEVANDGEVSALAGAMELNQGKILGISMGTSQGGGYVDENKNVTDWLNELAFVPVDLNENAIVDEWSKDRGVGVSYFSQDGVIKLAKNAGVDLGNFKTEGEKFRFLKKSLEENDKTVKTIAEDIGIYLGYSVPFYLEFYDVSKIVLLGGVMSGRFGEIVLKKSKEVLEEEFPEIFNKIELITLKEEDSFLGISIAAASLPFVE